MNLDVEISGGGTTNHIYLAGNEHVKKDFVFGNGVNKSIAQRLVSEYWSMKLVDISPQFAGVEGQSLFMSYIDGENQLDKAIISYPESASFLIYKLAGESLKKIHEVIRIKSGNYHKRHLKKCLESVSAAQGILLSKGINALSVYESLFHSYSEKEIDKLGLVWTHGDYWLNNLIGRRENGSFRLSGIIDWELAGLGSPYEDFAIVKMSIEDVHPESSSPFWDGYGHKPASDLQRHFAILKTLEWMNAEPEDNDLDSPFYLRKLQMIREAI